MCLQLNELLMQEIMEELAIPAELKVYSTENVPEEKELVTA